MGSILSRIAANALAKQRGVTASVIDRLGRAFLCFRSHQTPTPADFVSVDVDRLVFRVFKKPSTFVATKCFIVGTVKAAEDQTVDVTRQVHQRRFLWELTERSAAPGEVSVGELDQAFTAEAWFMAAMYHRHRQFLEVFHGVQIVGDVAVFQLVEQQAVVNGVAGKQNPGVGLPETSIKKAPRRGFVLAAWCPIGDSNGTHVSRSRIRHLSSTREITSAWRRGRVPTAVL